MNEQAVVDLEPQLQRRSAARVPSENQLKKADLSTIMGSEMLVLATAISTSIVKALEMKERRRLHRRLLLIACGLAGLLGLVRLAIQLAPS
jgi:hypothetical protein